MIYTFKLSYKYEGSLKHKLISAKIYAEALDMFYEWYTKEVEIIIPDSIYVEVIYNELDAEIYGPLYGTPQQYFPNSMLSEKVSMCRNTGLQVSSIIIRDSNGVIKKRFLTNHDEDVELFIRNSEEEGMRILYERYNGDGRAVTDHLTDTIVQTVIYTNETYSVYTSKVYGHAHTEAVFVTDLRTKCKTGIRFDKTIFNIIKKDTVVHTSDVEDN